MNAAMNTVSSSSECRITTCLPCKLVVELSSGMATFAVELASLSTAGMFVRRSPESPQGALVMSAQMQPFTRVLLELHLDDSPAMHEARGFVVWQTDLGVRIEFIDVTPALARIIAELAASEANAPALLSRISSTTLYQPR
jgi:hypothetical protein